MTVEDLIRLLLMLLSLLFAGESQHVDAPPPRSDQQPQPMVVENVQVQAMGGQTQLVVSGHWPDGCQAPALVDFRRDGDRIDVRIYRFISPMADCPAVIAPETQIVNLGVLTAGAYTVRANDFTTAISIGGAALPTATPAGLPGESIERRPVKVENVGVMVLESYPMGLHLVVSGYQDDACATEVFVEQRREDNTVFVDIYRLHNSLMMCPFARQPYQDTIVLEGGFISGDYIIRVNDYVVELTL